jgi:hypothetical protein
MNSSITLEEHFIKSYNVMLLGIVYLIFGLASAYFINKFSYDVHPNKGKLQLAIEICIEVAVTVLFSYIIHYIVEIIPLPMAGTYEIKQETIHQIRGGIVFAFSMFVLQIKLRNKIQQLFFGRIEDFEPVDLTG